MKILVLIGVLVFVTQTFVTPLASAQGTTYVSNLGPEVAPGYSSTASDLWCAAAFNTGTNTAGYLLNSVQLSLAGASGSPAGFSIALYANLSPNSIWPTVWLGDLRGSTDPSTAGLYSFTADATMTLQPNTRYDLVIMAATPVNTGSYRWKPGGGPQAGLEGWSIGGSVTSIDNGVRWSTLGRSFPRYSVTASVVPEPASLVLFGLGSLWLVTRPAVRSGRSDRANSI